MRNRQLDPIHPGEILREEFMAPLGLSANALAREIHVPVTRISEILRGRRGVTADTALRLARFFGTSADLWLGLQAEHDLRLARREVGSEIERAIEPTGRLRGGARGAAGGSQSVRAAEVREPAAAYGATGGKGGGQRRRSLGPPRPRR